METQEQTPPPECNEVPAPVTWNPACACLFTSYKLLGQNKSSVFTVASEGLLSLYGTYNSLIKPGPKWGLGLEAFAIVTQQL